MPRDAFGRDIDYLRLSLTDQCNLRCVYCMPLGELNFAPQAELLTCDELLLVARAAAGVGFRKIRLTGGEPTLRNDIVEIVRGLRAIEGIEDIALTTNGLLLPRLAGPLRAAGLSRVNIHVDSLDARNLRQVMRFSNLERVWAGVRAADEAGLHPIKLNCVVVRDYNDADVAELARLTLEHDWHVRFIELMPLGGGECARLSILRCVPTRDTRERIERCLGPLEELPSCNHGEESRNFRAYGARGVIGFISPVSEPYCDTCNRMRLTADGKFHLCLLHDDELDVKAAIRAGGGVERVRDILLRAVALKPTGHELSAGVSTRDRSMFQIGG